MTPQEFHFDFRLLSDEVEALANKSFNPAEIDWFLNRAQDELVSNRLNQNNIRRRGFEMDQKRIEDLKGILVKTPEEGEVALLSHDDNIYELDLTTLSHEYIFFVRASVSGTLNDCETNFTLTETQHDDMNDSLDDPFNQPSEKDILFNFGRNSSGNGSAIYFYATPGQVLVNAKIEYLKKPDRISLGTYTYIDGTTPALSNTDLSDHVHDEIVNRAVRIAAGVMKDPNLYQALMGQIQMEE